MVRQATWLCVILIVLQSGALLADSTLPDLEFNGFGTLGVVHSDERNADFVGDPFASEGAGYSGDWSAEVDSRLGLQATLRMTPQLSTVVQVISEKRYDGSFAPDIEWANVQYDVSPDLSLRVGRMVQSSFMASEHRKVNYATPWARPPQEVYRLIPVANFDGVDVRYRYHSGSVTNELQVNFGGGSADYQAGSIDASDSWGVSHRTHWGNTTLFASYGELKVSVDELTQFFDIYRLFGLPGEALANRYEVDGKRTRLMSLGAGYDPGSWFVMGEWAHFSSPSLLGKSEGAYMTFGYRIAEWTPYVGVARAKITSSTSEPGLNTALYPSPYAEGAQLLNGVLNEILSSGMQQDSITLGARWDFRPGMALTAQYDHIDMRSGSSGGLINQQPEFTPGGRINLFSLALDFVF
ncbi:porin [Halomonas sp. ISL-60]|uniref:porin n=1 Tax=Halomonas sp. ISL-56 TaxID=2819149 RepID=UPI001BE68557|nr:porin [Halomonas sp. ISL-56]MBT2774951.1 porin [Halomonas sp. ISL-60]MBT2802583.1 porin [Halomonas sp. ISL-56]